MQDRSKRKVFSSDIRSGSAHELMGFTTFLHRRGRSSITKSVHFSAFGVVFAIDSVNSILVLGPISLLATFVKVIMVESGPKIPLAFGKPTRHA